MIYLRDLNSTIPNARNFKYLDFVKSDTATRKNISNIPTEEEWQNVELLATNILQPLREKFGPIKISSGFRSVELCLAVGSNAKSWHSHGCAADIEPVYSSVKLYTILKYINLNLTYCELIAEFFDSAGGGWVHVAFNKDSSLNTKKIKLKDVNHNYEFVDLNYLEKLYG